MTSRTTRILRHVAVTGAVAVAFGPLAPPPASGAAVASEAVVVASSALRTVEREGRCRNGAGEWELEVRQARRGRLQIEFRVDNVGRQQKWQVFVADNGTRVAAVTRLTRAFGEFKLRKLIRNRRGRDRVAASAVNPRSGNTCFGRLRF